MNFFVNSVQEGEDDCEQYPVPVETLEILRQKCVEILAARKELKDEVKTSELADRLLPTRAGFFFGDTGYDDYYYEDLEKTIEIIDGALLDKEHSDFFYQSSW